MQLKKYVIKTYVTKELYQCVLKEAVLRKATMAKIIRDGLDEYFQLREELANAIEIPGSIGESHTGKIIHTLLARSEQRTAILFEQLEKKIILSHDKLNFVINMIDRFYSDLMTLLPKLPDSLEQGAIALGNLRHKKWINEVNDLTKND
jgi:hypothetical protein